MTTPACRSGACQQGRKPCPCPQACGVTDPAPEILWHPMPLHREHPTVPRGVLLAALGLTLAAWAVAGFFFLGYSG